MELLGPLTLIFTCLDESDFEEVEELELKLRLKLQPKAPTGPRERFPCCPPPPPTRWLERAEHLSQVDRIPSGGDHSRHRSTEFPPEGIRTREGASATKTTTACCKPFQFFVRQCARQCARCDRIPSGVSVGVGVGVRVGVGECVGECVGAGVHGRWGGVWVRVHTDISQCSRGWEAASTTHTTTAHGRNISRAPFTGRPNSLRRGPFTAQKGDMRSCRGSAPPGRRGGTGPVGALRKSDSVPEGGRPPLRQIPPRRMVRTSPPHPPGEPEHR